MSRCFPFPPPGYENKPPIEHLDLLAKEKPKEKKHKKEKKDKEKREGKDKKDKDKSKDKRKEKKDRKEKHKDKKKDKDKDKDKSRASNEVRNEAHAVPQNGEKVGGSSQKAGDVKDSKYAEEFGRRIRNEEKGVANRVVENSSGLLQNRNEIMGSGMPFGSPVQRRNECVGSGTAATAPIQKKNETCSIPKGIEIKDAGTSSTNSLQKRTESAGAGSRISSLDKRRVGGTNSITAIRRSLEKGIENADARTAINDSIQRSEAIDSGSAISSSLQKRTETMATGAGQKRNESKGTAMAADKERGTGNKMVANHIGTEERRTDGMDKLVEKDMDKRFESVGASMVLEKERAPGSKIVSNPAGKEEKRNSGLGKQVETDAEKRTGAKDKAKNREADRHRDKDREEKRNKSKHKDKDTNKEREKDKMRQKGEQREKAQEIIKDSSKKGLVDSSSIKLNASCTDSEKRTHVDESTKKRKDFEINGILHENDVRPNKLLKATPSLHPSLQNGRTLEPCHIPSPKPLIRHETSNSVKAAEPPDNKIHKENGITGAHTPSIYMKPSAAVETGGKGEISIKPPHRDCRYLSQVYSVPKMEEFSENDDQSWLFSTENCLQKKPVKLKAEELPQVWAQAMRIDSADVVALPYVIPY
ncbi:hypothetical protein IHE45_05G159200 [Dioscorea alata]|uniref:Uncharacterized protein n=1 Tax=Dioscorea alata TaxID=55571 RepID=A0ACB7W6K9_DIOAL|nr:hypothetical protein IHE45_05G159200 [Dioscorea alata]